MASAASTRLDHQVCRTDGSKPANLAVRFPLQLCPPGRAGGLGARTRSRPLLKVAVGHWGALAAAVVWGMLVAPGQRWACPGWVRLLLELLVFGLAVAAWPKLASTARSSTSGQ
jgi:hypothetical protein